MRAELIRKYADRGFGPTVLIEADQWSNRTRAQAQSGINICEADTWEFQLTEHGNDIGCGFFTTGTRIRELIAMGKYPYRPINTRGTTSNPGMGYAIPILAMLHLADADGE